MAMLTIRNLDDDLKNRLRLRAAANGRSMEEETRRILRAALVREDEPRAGLADAIRARFAPFGDIELQLPERDLPRDPPDFTGGAAVTPDAA